MRGIAAAVLAFLAMHAMTPRATSTPSQAAVQTDPVPAVACGFVELEGRFVGNGMAIENSAFVFPEGRLEYPRARVTGEVELPGRINRIQGSDPKNWTTDSRRFERVRILEPWSGIDIVVYENGGDVEYDFEVAAGIDASAIRLDATGIATIGPDGSLEIRNGVQTLVQRPPVAYQEHEGGGRSEVDCRYVVDGCRIGFELGLYDRSLPLVIDPVIVARKQITTAGFDQAAEIAVFNGRSVIVGSSNGDDFPVTMHAVDTAHSADFDGVILMVDPLGELIWATYLGGAGADLIFGVDVDADGNIFVCGRTASRDFPTTEGVLMRQFASSQTGFVAKLSLDGRTLHYSTFLGGNGTTSCAEVVADSDGSVLVAGSTFASNFPIVSATQPAYGGGGDGILARLNATASALEFSTYHGGSAGDGISSIAVDNQGSIWAACTTNSSDYPTVNPTQATGGGGLIDGAVARFSTTGTREFSTYLGGAGLDLAIAVAVNPDGKAFVGGLTDALGFPTTKDAEQTTGAGGLDGFLTGYDGDQVSFSTLIGGPGGDQIVDVSANAYAVAAVGLASTGFPTTDRTSVSGPTDGFVAYYRDDGVLRGSGVFGASMDDFGSGVALDDASTAHICGDSNLENQAGRIAIYEDMVAIIARLAADPVGPEARNTDLFVSVAPYENPDAPCRRGCLAVTIKNDGPEDYDLTIFCSIELTLPACGVTDLAAAVARKPADSNVSITPIRGLDGYNVEVRGLRKGESVVISICFCYGPDCQPGETVHCFARLGVNDRSFENNFDSATSRGAEAVPGHLLAWAVIAQQVIAAYVVGSLVAPTSPPGLHDSAPSARIAGFNVYASLEQGFVPASDNLLATFHRDIRWMVSESPPGTYYRVQPILEGGSFGAFSNEVGGPLPGIEKITWTPKKLTLDGGLWKPPLSVTFGAYPFAKPARIKNGGTRLVQKTALANGLRREDLIMEGSASGFVNLGNWNFVQFKY